MTPKQFRINILTLCLGMAFLGCEKESATVVSEESNEQEVVQTKSMEDGGSLVIDLSVTSDEELDEIVFPLIDDLEENHVLQMTPDLETNTLTLSSEPVDDLPNRVIHFSCSEQSLRACNSAADSFLDAGCGLQAYQSGGMYHYWADC